MHDLSQKLTLIDIRFKYIACGYIHTYTIYVNMSNILMAMKGVNGHSSPSQEQFFFCAFQTSVIAQWQLHKGYDTINILIQSMIV